MSVNTGVLASIGTIKILSASSGDNTSTTVDVSNTGLLLVHCQAASSWDGTLTFSTRLDGTNWVTTQGVQISNGTAITTATGTTLSMMFRFDVSGVLEFRAVISGHSTGTITVTARGVGL
jgi:hypothetical protein